MASGLENEFATLHEIVKAAKIRLTPNIWDYLIGGTETETTLRRNRMALDSIAFKPRVLRDVSRIDPSSEILGKKIRLPVMLAATGQDHQAAFSWDNFKRVKDRYPDVKFMLKGIGTAEDAKLACENGVWAVYCSNHGGRQLDHGRGSAEVLPEVIDAVAGRAKVAVDGLFCRGSDIVKAICLGADWVGLGRLYCYGLAA